VGSVSQFADGLVVSFDRGSDPYQRTAAKRCSRVWTWSAGPVAVTLTTPSPTVQSTIKFPTVIFVCSAGLESWIEAIQPAGSLVSTVPFNTVRPTGCCSSTSTWGLVMDMKGLVV